MLLIARTTEALSQEERDLRDLISAHPRTAPRPTDQQRGELKGFALEAFAAPYLLDEADEDIPFSPVQDDPPRTSPPSRPAPSSSPLPHTLPPTGTSAMHIQQSHDGNHLVHLTTTDLALLALVLRHATDNQDLLRLGPLMPTTLDSLASAFENATLVGLHQTGHLQLAPDTPLTAEAVQAWCQRVVAGGLPDRPAPPYIPGTPDRDTLAEG
jgi:hypothetical protein